MQDYDHTEQQRYEEDLRKSLKTLKIRLELTQDDLRDIPHKQRELIAKEAHYKREIASIEATLAPKSVAA